MKAIIVVLMSPNNMLQLFYTTNQQLDFIILEFIFWRHYAISYVYTLHIVKCCLYAERYISVA